MPCQTAASENDWSSSTASTITEDRWEIGVFGPLRYGYSERMELSTHPLADFLMPNLSVKISGQNKYGLKIATTHSFVYPTPLLRTLTKEGTGGFIAPDPTIPQIPHMFSLTNEILATREIQKGYSLTTGLGFTFAVITGELDERTTIDLPLVFPSLEVYYHGYSINYKVGLEKNIFHQFSSKIMTKIVVFPGSSETLFLDQRSVLYWNLASRSRLAMGYVLTYGEYPFGAQWHLLPLLDFLWVVKDGAQ